jgi:hypothetical protein
MGFRWICQRDQLMPHWNCCNCCLHTPHSMDRHSLQRVYDKGRKDHRFHEDRAQLPNSSSVLQHLQYEAGPQTCGKLAVFKIPVKECLMRILRTMERAYFMLSKNQVFFSQTKGGPCLCHNFPFMTLSKAASSQSIPVMITKFLRGHSSFENVYTSLSSQQP